MKKDLILTISIIVILLGVSVWAVVNTRGVHGPVIDSNMIAVPADGDNMDAPVSKYFGRAPYFIVYDIEKDAYWTVVNPFYGQKHAVGLRSGAMLVKKGIGVAVAGNIGPEPCRYFNNNGIKVYIGALGTVRDAVIQYKNNQLVRTTKPNVPTHYGVPGGKPCPNVLGQPEKRIPPGRMGGGRNVTAASWASLKSKIICPFCMAWMSVSSHNPVNISGILCPYCGGRISLPVVASAGAVVR